MRCGVVCLKLLAGEIEAMMRIILDPVWRSREASPLGQDGQMVILGTYRYQEGEIVGPATCP